MDRARRRVRFRGVARARTHSAPAADVVAITPTMAEVTISTDTNPGNRKLTRLGLFALAEMMTYYSIPSPCWLECTFCFLHCESRDPNASFANLAWGKS